MTSFGERVATRPPSTAAARETPPGFTPRADGREPSPDGEPLPDGRADGRSRHPAVPPGTASKAGAEPHPGARTEARAKTGAEARPDRGAKRGPQAGTETRPKTGAAVGTQTGTEARPKTEVAVGTQTGTQARPMTGAEARPAVGAGGGPQAGVVASISAGAGPAPRTQRAPMTGAEAVVQVLVEQGVEVVFGIPGGAVLPLYDALYGAPLRHVLARHEQGAALAADGYARASGRVGVCIATSGPGATNLITGLATSYLDSVPVVAITGNVGRAFLGTDAFQEADTFGVSMPVTKHNYLVLDPEELPAILREAFAVAASGRPGPVLVDIPKDVFTATIPPEAWDRPLRPTPVASAADGDDHRQRHDSTPRVGTHPSPWGSAGCCGLGNLDEAARLIARARRPVLYAGGGVIVAGAAEALRRLADEAVLPTTTTLMALGAMPGDHPLFLGMPGMHGTYAANMALTETDCLIAVGARFDDRVTGKVSAFAPDAAIIHIDVDAAELGKVKAPRVAIAADARQGLEALREALGRVRPDEWSDRSPWLERVNGWKQEYPYRYDRDRARRELLPQAVIEELERATAGDALVVTGVGQHQMWAAMFYRYRRPRQFLTSGGLGTMGYGLPAAIGAQLARPDARVLCIDGDGSFQMNVQELSTLAELGLPVKVFIINNRAHGMVRQWQDLFYGHRLSASVFEHQPDFVKLAEAYGVAAYRITRPDELAGTVREALARPGPVVVDCVVRQEEDVLPMVPPGAALKEMIVG